MFWYYIKSSIWSIRGNKKFSIINISGFAFGISVCLAISLFLIHEFSYDRYYENSDRIVRLNNSTTNMSMMDYRVKDILVENYPEIQRACLSLLIEHPIPISNGNAGFVLEGIMSVDNDFIELKNIYLRDNTVGFMGDEARLGNPGLLRLLTTIAFLILSLAVINYINLTVSQQIIKSKVIGIRKAIGARRSNILYQSIIESIVITSIAFILGIILVMVLLPWYEFFFSISLDIHLLFSFPYNIILITAIILLGIISGSGPAIALSAINPVRVLSGSTAMTGNRQYFRNSLTVFQFAVSTVLISCVMIVQKQVQYVKYTNPGFKAEQLIRVDLPIMFGRDDQRPGILVNEFSKLPYILNLSATQGVPGMVTNYMDFNFENSDLTIVAPTLIVDTAFLKTFDLKIIKGRDLEPEDYGNVCMINEAAWKHFQFENLENKRFNNYGGLDIIGVLNDFHYSSLHNLIEPMVIIFTPDESMREKPNFINIRFEGRNAAPLLAFIQEIWQEVMPGEPLQVAFYDEFFASMYRSEERFAGAIGLFALLAVVISCIGILGLAIFSTERRTKEIGIRKVNGAKISEVMLMLNSDFVKWVGIAFVIAIPVAWYSMNSWLQNFAYRTGLNWWVFALAGFMALSIALLTVSWQSWQVARRNPVEALRYE